MPNVLAQFIKAYSKQRKKETGNETCGGLLSFRIVSFRKFRFFKWMERHSQVVVPLEMIETLRSHNGDSNENITDTLTSRFFKHFLRYFRGA